jgi:hypothetical protein
LQTSISPELEDFDSAAVWQPVKIPAVINDMAVIRSLFVGRIESERFLQTIRKSTLDWESKERWFEETTALIPAFSPGEGETLPAF